MVSVWVGNFTDKAALVGYLKEEKWRQADRAQPLNQLCADFGMQWYDVDFQEVARLVAPKPVAAEQAIGAEEHLSAIRDDLLAACKRYGVRKFNAIFAMSADEGVAFAPAPKFLGKKVRKVPLVFLGTFVLS
jgi:hypothetical protein